MAIVSPERDIATTPPAVDPYRYGWRYVRRELPQGGETFDQVPLTLEDVLYPEVGDFHVHNKAHEDTCTYLSNVFNARLSDDPTAVDVDDVRVAWDALGLRPNGPDIAVISVVCRELRTGAHLMLQRKACGLSLIVEITSPETR